MKKNLFAIIACLFVCGCNFVVPDKTAQVKQIELYPNGSAKYTVRSDNSKYEVFFILPADFADVGDIIIYTNKSLIAVKP